MRDITATSVERQTDTAILRTVLVVDALVFLSAALFNEGVRIPLGFTVLGFPRPVWQAGIGETVIGLALLAAGVTGSVALSWIALWLSVIGIAFGLSSPAVEGPARDIHLLLVPLAIVALGLLVWQGQGARRVRGEAGAAGQADVSARPGAVPWEPISRAIFALMMLGAVAFAGASLIHSGVVIALGPATIADPFTGAAAPEAVIAIALAAGAVGAFLRRSPGWPLALASTGFSLLLTAYGLSITLRSGRTGDIIYHVTVLALLGAITCLLLLRDGRRSLGG